LVDSCMTCHAQFFTGKQISDEKNGIRMDAATGKMDLLK